MMRTDQSVRDLTEKHRYARSTGDEQGASRYKKMMTGCPLRGRQTATAHRGAPQRGGIERSSSNLKKDVATQRADIHSVMNALPHLFRFYIPYVYLNK